MTLDPTDTFQYRHLGPRDRDLEAMVTVTAAASLEALIDEVIPASIRLDGPLDLPDAESEAQFLAKLQALAAQNQAYRSFIGLGYYGCITPSVILRNVFENPGWYTPYTPYQAEVAQGRLEGLLNFQTMVQDLTSMEAANASLLDEATAAAEAMAMLHRIRDRRPGTADRFVVASTCFPQTIDVVKGRAEPLGLDAVVMDPDDVTFDDGTFGVLVQYPDANGAVEDLRPMIARAHEAGVLVAVATDLLALTLLVPPGEQGADVVVGSAQRFGVPIGYGGPHAAFFATRQAHARQMPGRLIGVSVDSHERVAYRMALQTREQHIRRDRATSNICTAQALLANIAGFYAVYHGPEGLEAIAQRVHGHTQRLASGLATLGLARTNQWFFDTLRVDVGSAELSTKIRDAAEGARINVRYFDDGDVGISLDETTGEDNVAELLRLFARATGAVSAGLDQASASVLPDEVRRTSPFLTHPVFNTHHSELQMMRYLKRLERKDIGLDTSMIPLGSCTMKLNAATEMIPVTWPAFSRVHPFVPPAQVVGYQTVFAELESALKTITGLAAVSLQPNSGAQGEFAGLMVIRAYHRARGDGHRNVVLIPASAHGTNPATAAMAGMRIVIVNCDAEGNVDLVDLKAKAIHHDSHLNALMITYPSTHGVFEEAVQEICDIVHAHGGQVYMDGAKHERAGGTHESRSDRGRRVPPEPAQDVRHPSRRWRSRHGADRGRRTPRAVPAWSRDHPDRGRRRHPGDVGGTMGERQHRADLVRLYQDARSDRCRASDPHRDSQRQLLEVAPRRALQRALHRPTRSGCPRADLRSAAVQGLRDHRAGRGEAPNGLRLPRTHGVVSGAGHTDGGADRERAA